MGQGSIACMRYILCAFTLVFVIFGVLLVYLGLSAFISFSQYSLVIHNQPDGATIALLVVGFIIFLISFLGCCGAITGNDFMLRTFAFILTLLLIIELVTVVFVYAFRKTIRDSMESGLNEAIIKYNETDLNAVTKMINDIQIRFECCGAIGPQDWKNNSFYEDGVILPNSCCPQDMLPSQKCTIITEHNKIGCLDQISQELKSSLSYLGSMAITTIIFQIIGLAFACMLTGQRRQYSYV